MWIQNKESNNMNYRNKNKTLYFNLIDSKNFDLRFSLLNKEIEPTELVKMKAEDLAPSSLKSQRLERQTKYFKEQVLVADDNKIMTKDHKGVSIIVVNEPGKENNIDIADINENKESIFANDEKESQYKSKDKDGDKDKATIDTNSDRGSWSVHSDRNLNSPTGFLNRNSSNLSNKVRKIENDGKLERGESNLSAIANVKQKELSFSLLNISKNSQDFYNSLEEFTFVIWF